jgi:hypothetical protein
MGMNLLPFVIAIGVVAAVVMAAVIYTALRDGKGEGRG